MLLHRIEVAIVVQQGVMVRDAEGGDDEVGGFADGNAEGAQRAVMLRRLHRQIRAQQRHHRVLAQRLFDPHSLGFVPRTLQHFQQD